MSQIEELKKAVEAAKAQQAETQKQEEERAELIKEAKELGIDLSKYIPEEKVIDTKKQQVAETVDEKQEETEEKDEQNTLILEAINKIEENISNAISKAKETDQEDTPEPTTIYM